MKIIDLISGLRTIISNEENLLLEKIKSCDGSVLRSSLTEREVVLANDLVKKGVLTRARHQDKLCYQLDDPAKIWRI